MMKLPHHIPQIFWYKITCEGPTKEAEFLLGVRELVTALL